MHRPVSVSYLGENTSKKSIFMWNLWKFSDLIVIPNCFGHLFRWIQQISFKSSGIIVRIIYASCLVGPQINVCWIASHLFWLAHSRNRDWTWTNNTLKSRTADKCKSVLIYMTTTFVAHICMLETTMRWLFFTHFAVKRLLHKTKNVK